MGEGGLENLSFTSSVKSFWLIVAEQEKGSAHKFLSEILSLQTQHVPDIRTSQVPVKYQLCTSSGPVVHQWCTSEVPVLH